MLNRPGSLFARRAGLIAFVVVILVFGSELTLSQLRRRDISVSLRVITATPAPGATQAAVPTEAPGQPAPTKTPTPSILIITPNDELIVNVQWSYRIGPRFPRTIVRATAKIENRSVGEGRVIVDCGGALLDCTGSEPISLRYTIPDTGSGIQTVTWPVGDYTLLIERSLGDLQYTSIQQSEFRVR